MKDEQVKKLLKGAGYPDSVFADSEKDDFKIEEIIEANNDSQKEHYEGLLKSDIQSGVKDEVFQKAEGEVYAAAERAMKRDGMDIEEVKELKMKEKIIKYGEFLKTKYTNTKDQTKLKEEFDTLQKDHLELKNTLTDKEEEWTGKYSQVVKDEEAKSLKKEVDLTMHKHFQTIPENRIVGGKRPDGFYAAVKSVIDSKYDVTMDKGEVVYLEKGTSTRAKGKKEGREEFLSTEDVMNNELKNLSLLVQSNGNPSLPPTPPGTPAPKDGDGKPIEKSARLIEMENEIAKQKAEQR